MKEQDRNYEKELPQKQEEQTEEYGTEGGDSFCCEYEGYQVRVRFAGQKTLAQCIKDLLERENRR